MIRLRFGREAAGAFYSFLAAFFWATYYIAGEYMIGKRTHMDPVSLAFCRFSLGGLILFVYLFFKSRKELFSLTRKELLVIAVQSEFMLVIMSSFLFWGQHYTSSINAALIMTLAPILTLTMGAVTRTEKVGFLQTVSMIVATLGCILVVTDGKGGNFSLSTWRGDLLVLISATSWSAATIIGKRVTTRKNAFAVTVWSMLIAALSLGIAGAVKYIIVPNSMCLPESPLVWGYLLYLGVIPTAIAFYAWYKALGTGSLNIVNAVQNTESLLAVGLAFFLLHSPIGWYKALGIVLAVAGVAGAAKFRKKEDSAKKTHSASAAEKTAV